MFRHTLRSGERPREDMPERCAVRDDEFLDVDQLGGLVRERRERESLTLRAAAEQAEVSFNTLSRVERGHIPDLPTFHRIVAWLGEDPGRFFSVARVNHRPTPEVIAEHLRTDPRLNGHAAETIAALVRDLYTNLVTRNRVAVHLRAAKTFEPEAARVLAGILRDVEDQLTRTPS